MALSSIAPGSGGVDHQVGAQGAAVSQSDTAHPGVVDVEADHLAREADVDPAAMADARRSERASMGSM
jgi:hypothetical protein